MSEQIRDQLQATLGSAYTLERELGGGGMSKVFVAEETALRRKVVVKVLPPELTAGVNVERFNREILLAAKLQHPHIVPVLAAGETNGLPYYTMPLVEGESLRARLARGGMLPITEAVGFLRDVSRALAYAHERGIVHRDIKPDNVLITGGSATVTDFGIAKAISASRTQGSTEMLTQVGTSIGTPTYMSPEQASGDPDTDHRADIYSFGCMAYELLAGRPPFVESAPRKLLAAHMGEKPKPVTEFRPDTPHALADLVMRCLAKEAEDRPQHATDLVRGLETVTSSGSGNAMPAVLLGGPGMFKKALAMYAGAFVAVAILAKAAIVGIGLPDWVFPGSLIVMALGLPMILWTGYVQRVARRAMTMTPTYTPSGSPSMMQGTIATMALKAAPRMSWYRTARGGMYVFGAFVLLIAAFMAMRQFGIGPFGSLIAAGQLRAKDPLIMTDFTVSSGDTALGRVVSFAVRTALGQSQVIAVMNQSAVAGALARMDHSPKERVDLPLAQGIATREGVKAIVDGEVTAVGGGYVLTLRLLTTDSAKVLATVQASGNGPQGLIEAADKVARDLRAKAGESLRMVQGAIPLARARTASLEALKKYSEGATAVDVELDNAKAIRLLKEAVTIDTAFAEAWRKMGIAQKNHGLPRSVVDSSLAHAYLLRGRLPEGEQASIAATYFSDGPGRDRVKAIAAYERAIQLMDLRNNNMANGLMSRREFARAESLFRADVRRDSSFQIAHNNLVTVLTLEGKFAEADSMIRVSLRRFPKASVPRRKAIALMYFRGQVDSARRAVDSSRAASRGADFSEALQMTGSLELLGGRVEKWKQVRSQLLGVDSSLGRKPSSANDAAATLALLTLVRGKADPAGLKALDAALAKQPLRTMPDGERPDLSVATAYAVGGNPERARAVLADFESSVRDTALKRSLQPDLHTARGWISLADHKPQDAIAEFRKGDVAPDGPANSCSICLPMLLARAFDAANQPDSAIAAYERYVSTPSNERLFDYLDPSVLAPTHERLGQLYEAKGQNDKAAEHYRAFIELWKNADPELQPRVTAAKERLKKLTPVEKPKQD
ncbi:MAG: protein kinase [Gemmatimonadetes bacterium]|nr:protein kinase [Gemmatimonadota bacterium]